MKKYIQDLAAWTVCVFVLWYAGAFLTGKVDWYKIGVLEGVERINAVFISGVYFIIYLVLYQLLKSIIQSQK